MITLTKIFASLFEVRKWLSEKDSLVALAILFLSYFVLVIVVRLVIIGVLVNLCDMSIKDAVDVSVQLTSFVSMK